MAKISTTHFCPFASNEEFECLGSCALALEKDPDEETWICSFALIAQQLGPKDGDGPLYEAQEVEEL